MIVYLGNQKLNKLYSGDKEVLAPTTDASINFFYSEYLLVAAGGTGATSGTFGRGGGGAGGLLSGSANFTYGESYNIVINSGGNSTFYGLTSSRGGNGASNGTGQSGGSGGGAAGGIFVGASGIVGQGNKGGNCNGSNVGGGGGGGANGAGGDGGLNAGAGGDGKQSAINGTLTYYSGGGGGGYNGGLGWLFEPNGQGGGTTSYGGGSQASNTGTNAAGEGICIIRYKGPQKATGGTITTDGSDVIHTFTTSGTFTIYGK
jgi:hypothetical protein